MAPRRLSRACSVELPKRCRPLAIPSSLPPCPALPCPASLLLPCAAATAVRQYKWVQRTLFGYYTTCDRQHFPRSPASHHCHALRRAARPPVGRQRPCLSRATTRSCPPCLPCLVLRTFLPPCRPLACLLASALCRARATGSTHDFLQASHSQCSAARGSSSSSSNSQQDRQALASAYQKARGGRREAKRSEAKRRPTLYWLTAEGRGQRAEGRRQAAQRMLAIRRDQRSRLDRTGRVRACGYECRCGLAHVRRVRGGPSVAWEWW